jgi:predicted acylesterase/phospholipase RssA
MMILVLLVVLALFSSVYASEILRVEAYQTLTDFTLETDFPEYEYVRGKPSTAIAFSGGGARSYLASIGYLAGLTKLDLMRNVRYIGGVSGGAWATVVYSYVQGIKDNVFLGNVVFPEHLTDANLKSMHPKCARGFAKGNVVISALKSRVLQKTKSIGSAWSYGVSDVYLKKANINFKARYTWNKRSLAKTLKRNRGLAKDDFMLVTAPDRPFPIIGATLMGPVEASSTMESENKSYTFFEFTPLYAGQINKHVIDYGTISTKMTVGGLVENIAYSSNGERPVRGLFQNESSAVLAVPKTSAGLSLRFITGASSFVPGAALEALAEKSLNEEVPRLNYWTPTSKDPEVVDAMFTDGGSTQNIPLISFLQRRVKRIVLFLNSNVPLSSTWNAKSDTYSGAEISVDLSCYFGVMPDESMASTAQKLALQFSDLKFNQVFPKEDFAVVVESLQKAQQKGSGAIATFFLTTIANKKYGIPAGIRTQITFVYLSRAKNWEAKLRPALKNKFVPPVAANTTVNYGQNIRNGEFKGFPNYATSARTTSFRKANALSNFAAWTIIENEQMFRAILSK